jgi:transposase-like protein
VIVPKRCRRLAGVDQIVVAVCEGSDPRDLGASRRGLRAKVSKETVTRITDRVIETVTDWQNRPLEPGCTR